MTSEPVNYRILGSVEIRSGGGRIELGTPQLRSLLATLLLHRHSTVSAETIIASLWDEPPHSAAKRVHVLVSELRRQLPVGLRERLTTVPGGYHLAAPDEEVDAWHFERLLESARELRDLGPVVRANETLQAAERLWRGRVAEGTVLKGPSAVEAARLEELRATAAEDRLEGWIEAERIRAAIPELQGIIARFPFRERSVKLLMVALYRTGRQVEALECFRRFDRSVREELGLEASPDLQALHRAILSHEEGPPLSWRAAKYATTPQNVAGGRRCAAALTVGFALVAVTTLATYRLTGPQRSVPPAAIVGLTAAGKIRHVISFPAEVTAIASAPDGRHRTQLFVALADRTVCQIDPSTGTVVASTLLPAPAHSLAIGPDALYAASGTKGIVFRLFRRKLAAMDPLTVATNAPVLGVEYAPRVGPILISRHTITIVPADWPVLRRVGLRRVNTQSALTGVGLGGVTSIWAASEQPPGLVRTPSDGDGWPSARFRLQAQPVGIARTGGSTWTGLAAAPGQVVKIDPDGRATSYRVSGFVTAVVAAAGRVWTANSAGEIQTVDPRSGRVSVVANLHRPIQQLTAAADLIWVGLR